MIGSYRRGHARWTAGDALRAMSVREIAPWLRRRPDYAAALAEYERHNRTRDSLFLFRVENGGARILDKPQFYTRAQLDALPTDKSLADEALWAAVGYREFLAEVAAAYCRDIEVVLAIDLADGGFESPTAPIFAIQKLAGSDSVLVPHHEFILSGFHESCRDTIPYRDKSLRASFIGSTTGGGENISVESVRNLAFPRLRSAVFFKDHPLVDFWLTRIVLCSPEAERLLREMGFGTGDRRFEEQFSGKFIISIGGNAGTCSRVSLSLKSNCVPLIYHSPHTMHYSSQLVPWLHYVPIGSDPEVNAVLELERRCPGLFEHVARAGTRFFEDCLTRQRLMQYTADLIRLYVACFGELCHENVAMLDRYSAHRARLWRWRRTAARRLATIRRMAGLAGLRRRDARGSR